MGRIAVFRDTEGNTIGLSKSYGFAVGIIGGPGRWAGVVVCALDRP